MNGNGGCSKIFLWLIDLSNVVGGAVKKHTQSTEERFSRK